MICGLPSRLDAWSLFHNDDVMGFAVSYRKWITLSNLQSKKKKKTELIIKVWFDEMQNSRNKKYFKRNLQMTFCERRLQIAHSHTGGDKDAIAVIKNNNEYM